MKFSVEAYFSHCMVNLLHAHDSGICGGVLILTSFWWFDQVLQEVLRSYSVPEDSFGRVCVIIDKVSPIYSLC